MISVLLVFQARDNEECKHGCRHYSEAVSDASYVLRPRQGLREFQDFPRASWRSRAELVNRMLPFRALRRATTTITKLRSSWALRCSMSAIGRILPTHPVRISGSAF